MRRSGVARRIVVVTVTALLGVAPIVSAPTTSGAATPGVWGAQQAVYVDGTVCRSGATTSPLASWNFGDPGLDFLLTAVTSTGLSDSALLPQAGTPGRTVSPVSAGQFGMSQSDISTFAAMISLLGSGPDPDAAETASAILQTSDPGAVPSCVSPGAALALKAAAARAAGPYTVSVSPASATTAAGASSSVTVRVTNASGQAVPNLPVQLSATALLFNGSATTTARTDGTGMARVPFTAPQESAAQQPSAQGSALTSAAITASASVSVGLEAVTVPSGFGQRYASAVYADPPTTYQGTATVSISQGADPVLTSKLASTAITANSTLSLAVQLTGMFGHTGQATFSVAGPVKLDATKLCAGVTPAAFKHTGSAAHSDVNVAGDSALTGGQWKPAQPGCYLLTSTVVTTNATPQATAHGPQTVITVLDTQAAATRDHTVIAPSGKVSTTVAVTHAYQRPGILAGRLLGPLTPGDGDCPGADWSKAPSAALASTRTAGDGTYTMVTGTLTKPGCYLVRSALELDVASRVSATVPLSYATAGDIIYVLAPTISASANVTSVVSPATVQADVTVQNTFGQPGHVSLQMLHVPDDHFACRRANFSSAAVTGSGPAASVNGDGVVRVTSGATSSLGCYALVPKLVMDGNAAVVATGVPSTADTVLAGVGLAPPPVRSQDRVNHSMLSTYLTLAVTLLLLMLTSFGVFRFVTRVYEHDGEGDERPSPFGSRLGGLFGDRG